MLRFNDACVLGAIRLACLGAAVALVAPAWGFSTGQVGFSGKQGVICNSCHAGGMPPTVSFDGPAQVQPGAQATYTFSVTSASPTQTAAGLDVAASGGELGVVDGQGTRRVENMQDQTFEITHTTPKANTAGVATFQFTWMAPTTDGMFTLFGAGNSVNLNGDSNGDRGTATMFTVMVSAAADTPTPTFTPTTGGEPTPTSGPVPCVGDCDGNGAVAINELIVGVNIALEIAPVTECEPFDSDDNGQVSVNELVAGVNAALGECVP